MKFNQTKKLFFLFTLIFSLAATTAFAYEYAPTAEQKLAATLREIENYHVIGWSFSIDPNIACALDWQNPTLDVQFMNPEGKVRSKRFKANIYSWGYKFEATIKFNAIFILGTDNRLYNMKTISLGAGIDLNVSFRRLLMTPPVPFLGALLLPIGGLGFTYAPFKNIPGGILIISFLPPLTFNQTSASLVLGGTLTAFD